MKFVFPIENGTAERLYAINSCGESGFYPIGLNNSYHGGVHLAGDFPVVAIADGTVIAYRYAKKYLEEKVNDKKYRYSNCFVLIRHEYTTPNGELLVFFSHYNHLRPWEEYGDKEKKRLPSFLSKQGFRITSPKLNVRSSMDDSKETNIIKSSSLQADDEVVASAVDKKWAKKEGVDEYFVHKGHATSISIPIKPELDTVAKPKPPIKVKAGDLIGYTGLYEMKGLPDSYTIVHVEVLAGPEAETFITNPKKDGENNPTHLRINANTDLKKKEKKYPKTTLVTTIKADTAIAIKESDPSGEWAQVQEISIVKDCKRDSLEKHENQKTKEVTYTVKKRHLAEIQNLFDVPEITEKTEFKFIQKVGKDLRKIEFIISTANVNKGWVETSKIDEGDYDTATVNTDIPCYKENPGLSVFTAIAGKTVDTMVFELKGAKIAADEKNQLWYKVGSDSWICEKDNNCKKISPFDWQEFELNKEKNPDPIIDFENPTPFFKKIIDSINTNKDKEISEQEIKFAQKLPDISRKLSRIICCHQSEWWIDDQFSGWDPIFKMVGKDAAERMKLRLKNLRWWNDVAKTVTEFLTSPNAFHWNPIAFVEQMRKMNHVRAPWMKIALDEAKAAKGLDEGTEPLYSMVLKYFHSIGIHDNPNTKKIEDDPTEVAWCASCVSWCLDQTIFKSPKASGARFYIADDPNYNIKSKELLKKVEEPVYGAVATFSDCTKSGVCEDKGHVGFVYGKTPDGTILVLGGNQGNHLKLSEYDCSGDVFLSYIEKNGKKHYKKFRGFFLPIDFEYDESDKLSEENVIKSGPSENKKITGVRLKTKRDSSR